MRATLSLEKKTTRLSTGRFMRMVKKAKGRKPQFPFKVGILGDAVALFPDIPVKDICRVLRILTSDQHYLETLVRNADRYDLDGNPCGRVRRKHAIRAVERLQEIQAREDAKCQAAV